MQEQQPQTEAEKNIAPGLLQTIRRFSMLVELVHDVAQMRYYQKAFFKERDNPKTKQEYLAKSKEFEKRVDNLLDTLWPNEQKNSQQKLF